MQAKRTFRFRWFQGLLRGDSTLRTTTKTRKHVMDVCKRLGGVRSLPGTQNSGLNVIVPFNRINAKHTVTPLTQRPDSLAFDRYLYDNGGQMNITFFDHDQRLDLLARLIKQTDYCQGLLLHRGIAEPAIEKMFARSPFPHVCIDPDADRYQLNTLFADERGGTMQVVAHLKEFGHKRIGYMGTPRSSRYKLFDWILKDEGLSLHPDDIQMLKVAEEKENDDHTAWRKAAKETLINWANSEDGIECSALYCQNDAMALGVIDAMDEVDLVIGEDLSVIGNDDIESRGGMYGVKTKGKPFLTTVHNPLEEVGERAAQWMLEQHMGESKRITHEKLPMKLIVRQTTGPAKIKQKTAQV